MLKRIVIALSSFVMLAGACRAAEDIEYQEKIRTKSAEWMAQIRQVDKLKAQKKWDEAESVIRKIMAERQELKLDLGGEKKSLAELFEASGKLNDAEKMYKEQIADRETHDGVDDFILVPVLNQYAVFLRKHARAKEALALEVRAKAIEADINKPPKKQLLAITGDTRLNSSEKYAKLCDLAKRFLDSDNPTKASYACSEAIKVNPYKPKAYKMRAQCYYQTEKLQQALEDLNNALKAEPKDAEALFDRGRLYQSLNKPLLAMKDFDASIEVRPNDTEALGYRAKQNEQLGRIDKAIADYTAAIRENPRAHWAFIQRSLLYRDKKKDVDQALKDIDRAIALSPRNIDDWELRAETLLKAKRLKEAIADASKMVELEPQNTQGYSMRSRIYQAAEGPKSKSAAADLSTIEKLRKATP